MALWVTYSFRAFWLGICFKLLEFSSAFYTRPRASTQVFGSITWNHLLRICSGSGLAGSGTTPSEGAHSPCTFLGQRHVFKPMFQSKQNTNLNSSLCYPSLWANNQRKLQFLLSNLLWRTGVRASLNLPAHFVGFGAGEVGFFLFFFFKIYF